MPAAGGKRAGSGPDASRDCITPALHPTYRVSPGANPDP
jgi:hypothetical protein